MELIPEDGLLHDWCRLYENITEAPPESHLAAGIAVIGAAIGWHAWTNFGDKLEPCNVSPVLVGSSGAAKKTTVLNIASQMISDAYMGDPDPPLRIRRQGHASSRGIIEALAPTDHDTRKLWEREPPPRNLWAWDEIGKLMKADGSWKDETRGVLLGVLEGRQPGTQTGKKKAENVALPCRCSLSILGTMTRAELDERSKESVLTDGFLGRFLLIDVSVSDKAIPFPLEHTTELAVAKAAIVRGLRMICEAPPKGCITTLFTTDAKVQRARWYASELDRIRELERANERIGGAVRNHFARVQATCARVAMILSVAGGRTQITKADELLAEEMVGRSMDTIEALAIFAAVSDQDLFATRVLEAVSKNGGVAVNDAIRGLRPVGMDWQKGEYVIRMLVNGGDILLDQRPTTEGPRNYLVKPAGEAP